MVTSSTVVEGVIARLERISTPRTTSVRTATQVATPARVLQLRNALLVTRMLQFRTVNASAMSDTLELTQQRAQPVQIPVELALRQMFAHLAKQMQIFQEEFVLLGSGTTSTQMETHNHATHLAEGAQVQIQISAQNVESGQQHLQLLLLSLATALLFPGMPTLQIASLVQTHASDASELQPISVSSAILTLELQQMEHADVI